MSVTATTEQAPQQGFEYDRRRHSHEVATRFVHSLPREHQERLASLIEARLGLAAKNLRTSLQLMDQIVAKHEQNPLLISRLGKSAQILRFQERALLESARDFKSSQERRRFAEAILEESRFNLVTGNTIQGLLDDGKSLNQELGKIVKGDNPASLMERWQSVVRPVMVWSLAKGVTNGHLSELTLPKYVRKGENAPPALATESWTTDQVKLLLKRVGEISPSETLPHEAALYLLKLVASQFQCDVNLLNFTLRTIVERNLPEANNLQPAVNTVLNRLREQSAPFPEDLLLSLQQQGLKLNELNCNHLAEQLPALATKNVPPALRLMRQSRVSFTD